MAFCVKFINFILFAAVLVMSYNVKAFPENDYEDYYLNQEYPKRDGLGPGCIMKHTETGAEIVYKGMNDLNEKFHQAVRSTPTPEVTPKSEKMKKYYISTDNARFELANYLASLKEQKPSIQKRTPTKHVGRFFRGCYCS